MGGQNRMSRNWKRGLGLLMSVALIGCQTPQSSVPIMGLPGSGGPGGDLAPGPALQNVDTQIVGRVDFPELAKGYGVQATSDYITRGATLTLVSMTDNMTVVTGLTQPDGTFVLPINGFSPAAGSLYLLEASRGLNNHAAGSSIARFRTYLRWTGTAWTSISGSSIVINPQTTAVAIISSLDAANVPISGTMGKVSGTTVNAAPAFNGHPNVEIENLATSISSYLTNDFDPVGSTTGLTPRITALQPANPALNGATVISGTGFSPIPTGNSVRFEGATASIFAASPTSLGVYVPSNAPNFGRVTVETSTGTSTDNAAYTISASGGGGAGGGGGDSSLGGFAITALEPAVGVPGDIVMIRGLGFHPTTTSNTVVFTPGATATVTYSDVHTIMVNVPQDAVPGPIRVTVAGETRGFFFNVNLPTVTGFTPENGNDTNAVTITGYNFGLQAGTSRVRFNGLPVTNFTRWSPSEIVLGAPAPNLNQRITGPISIINHDNRLGRDFGTFTARRVYDERFTATTQRDGAASNTTAAWATTGFIEPGPAGNPLNHFGSDLGGAGYVNTGVMVSAAGARLPITALRHTGVLPTNNTYNQTIGVDDQAYYVTNGGTGTNFRYNRLTGTSDGSQAARISNPETIVWNRSNGHYYIAYSSNSHVTSAWNSSSWIGQSWFNYTTMYALATNGTHVMGFHNNGVGYYWTNTNGGVSTMTVPTGYIGAAGLVGYPRFLVVTSSGNISALNWYNPSGGSTSGTMPLPFQVTTLSNGHGVRIGSDGESLYLLGRNANFNANADSLFRFTVNQATHEITSANAVPGEEITGTVISPVINRPTNHIWHQVAYSRGTNVNNSCQIDIVETNAPYNVILADVADGQNLNTLTAASFRLRATLRGTPDNSPTLTSWNVSSRGSQALSRFFDTGSIAPDYETETVERANEFFTIQYQTSTDGTNASSAWVDDPSALEGRYIRFRVVFSRSNGRVTRVNLPYTY